MVIPILASVAAVLASEPSFVSGQAQHGPVTTQDEWAEVQPARVLPLSLLQAQDEQAPGESGSAVLPLSGSKGPSERGLHVDLLRDGAIAAGSIAAAAVSGHFLEDLVASSCHWCGTNHFDVWWRDRLLWGDPGAARTASDVLVVVVPAGAAAALALSSGLDGPRRRLAEDFVLVGEAFGITMLGDQVMKLATARQRPYAYYAPNPDGPAADNVSFWSGHTALTFSAATAAGTVARLRGYPEWPWILGLGLTGATATAYFRVAGDRHWMTDVLAGAAWGSAVGVAVPLLHLRSSDELTVQPRGKGVLVTLKF